MKFINNLVGHGKINRRKITFGKPHTTKGNIIDFGIFKIAIKEITIDKSYGLKRTIGKITEMKDAIFEFFELNISFEKEDIMIHLVCKIIFGHKFVLNCQS
jgi:hypothetical protein